MTTIGTPGGTVFFGPKAVTVADKVHIFVATGDGRSSARFGLQIKYATWNGKSWSNFTALPDPASKDGKYTVKFSHGFSVVRTPDNKKLHLVSVTEEGFMARTILEGTKWSSWEPFEDTGGDEGAFDKIPYVVVESDGKLGYYAQYYDNSSIAYKQWDGSKFIPSGKAWRQIDLPGFKDDFFEDWLVSSPSDLSSQHIWLLSSNFTLVHATVRGDKLSSFETLGDASNGLPSVSHRDSTSIDISGFLYEKYAPALRSFDGKKWGEWQTVKSSRLGGRAGYEAPAVAFFPPNNLHVFDVTFAYNTGVVSTHKNNGTWNPKLDAEDDVPQLYSVSPVKASILSKVASAGQQVLKQWL